MHIHWLIPCEFNNLSDVHQINLASIRLRAGGVVLALQKLPHTITLGEKINKQADVCVVGKIGAFDTANKHGLWISQLRAFKGRIILDFTDDHLNYLSSMTAFYLECLSLACRVVCSSPWLERVVMQYFSGPVHMVPDAIEYHTLPPKLRIHSPLTLLWFGHATNIGALINFIPQIQSVSPLRIIVVSNQQGLQLLGTAQLHTRCPIEIQGRVWSQEATIRASIDSDICIIPAELDNMRKSGVSSNRLLTALALGMPVCADQIDSYLPYKSFFGNLRTLEFNKICNNPLLWREKIENAQKSILPDYSLLNLGVQWLEILES